MFALLNRVTDYIVNLKPKELKQQLGIIIISVTIITIGSMYYIYYTSNQYITYTKQIQGLAEKSAVILANNERIQHEENRIQEILSQNKDFDIKSYFEQFCREHKITPEPSWGTTINPIEGNNKFEEIILSATFKNETTKTLAKILDTLDKNEIVYLAELAIKKENDKIAFDLVIATKKMRRNVEE
jgi:hypothetical protein